MDVGYRLWQVWRNLTAVPLSSTEEEVVTAVLTPDELTLFRRFSLSDQQHSYRVLCTLLQAGYTHTSLLKAALLHDVGKTRFDLTIWERSLAVLLDLLWPQQGDFWGQGEAHGWQRPFVVKAQHPAWGADMVAVLGADPLTVTLIRRHQDRLPEPAAITEDQDQHLLRLLQWADDQN